MDKELIAKAKQAKTPEELYEMAKEVGREMTEEKENKKRPIRCAYCHTFGAACNCMCRSWCSGMGMPAPSDASTCAARSGIIDESTCGI